MRRLTVFAIIFAVLGLGAWAAGQWSARAWEKLVTIRVTQGFEALGVTWAEVEVDGYHLMLTGRAPDEVAHGIALDTVRGIARGIVVSDETTVRPSPPPPRPALAFDLLRDGEGVTLTGNLSGEAMHSALIEAVGDALPIHDFSGIAAQRPRPGWGAEIAVAGQAVRALDLAEISVVQGNISIRGIAADATARDALTGTLRALAGEQVDLLLELRVPRRVISPFLFAMQRTADDATPRFEACAARTPQERDELERLVARLDPSPGGGRCEAGLGGPEGDWLGASRAAAAALEAIPAGRVTLNGQRVVLTGFAPTSDEAFTAAMTGLASDLPDGFDLTGRIEEVPEEAWARARLTYWLRAESGPDGTVALEGVAPGARVRDAVAAYAAALFGTGRLKAALTVSDLPPPPGWHSAALAALSGLAVLNGGSAQLSGESISLDGTADTPATAVAAHRIVAAAGGYQASSRIVADLPSALARIELPQEACAARIGAMVTSSPILFEPGQRGIAAESRPLIPEIADVLARCPAARFEVAGHTDSQGADDMNLRLSRTRAEAVLDALIAAGISRDRLGAEGYGETEPVADNATAEGRALNRRIEFRPLEPAPEGGQ